MHTCTALILLAVLAATCLCQEDLLVTLSHGGQVRGSITTTQRGGRQVRQFLAVPYGNSPEGEGRFKAPTPANWTGERDASSPGPACTQFIVSLDGSSVHWASRALPNLTREILAANGDSEDCLTLDLYVPANAPADQQLPVLVFFHGGAFIGGSSQLVQQGFLLDYDMVLVAPQYRLGPLGFLTLDTEDAPGNAALFDMLEALHWVQDNVELFGGDPARVTIAGQSAGATMAGLLALSPLSGLGTENQLFHQILEMSGTALAPYAIDPKPVENSRTIARFSGCIPVSIECLYLATVEELKLGFFLNMALDVAAAGNGLAGSMPIVQTSGDQKVIEEAPITTLQNGQFVPIPTLLGVMKHEGIFIVEDFVYTYYRIINPGDPDLTECLYCDNIQELIFLALQMDQNLVIGDALQEKYFLPESLASNEAMEPSLVDFMGALYFKGPAETISNFNGNQTQTYLYTFSHQDVYNFNGASHGGDLIYLFPYSNYNLTEEEEEVSKKVVELYAYFIIEGNPTPDGIQTASNIAQWTPYSVRDNGYLKMDTTFTLQSDFEKEFTVGAREGLTKQENSAAYHQSGSVWFISSAIAVLICSLPYLLQIA